MKNTGVPLKPFVTVITINYRNARGLERTIKSVADQDYPNIEFVVKDGASGGDDEDVIRRNSGIIDHVNSCADSGIYDAMNLALSLATSEWVIFMNSGDVFFSKRAVSELFESADIGAADIVCGNAWIEGDSGGAGRFIIAEPAFVIPYRMNACHQAMLIKKSLLERFPFVVGPRRIASDYGFVLKAFLSQANIVCVNVIVARCESGGVSQVNRLDSLRDRLQHLRENGICGRWIGAYYAYLMVRARMRPWLVRPMGCFR